MKEGEGPALKPGARKAEMKAWGSNTEILEMCGPHFRGITSNEEQIVLWGAVAIFQ